MPQRLSIFPDRQPSPVYRGQGNLPFRSEEKNRILARGQDALYNINGAPTGAALADGDYGDIVVSGSGAAMDFDPAVVTAFARTILDDPDAPTVRATIGAQTADADLDTLAANITAFGHSLVDDNNAAEAQTTLGLGTAATANQAAAQADSTAPDVATLVSDFNALLAKLRAANLMA